MAKAAEPRPRRLSAGFGAYFLVVLVFAYVLSPRVAAYVDPGATLWILAAYMLLGALALVGLGAGALRRARRLDERIDDLEASRRRVRRAATQSRTPGPKAPRHTEPVVDSGSPDREVELLLDGLQTISDSVSAEIYAPEALGVDPETDPERDTEGLEALAAADLREVGRLRRARDAVAATLVGPAVAAVAIVGAFAPFLVRPRPALTPARSRSVPGAAPPP